MAVALFCGIQKERRRQVWVIKIKNIFPRALSTLRYSVEVKNCRKIYSYMSSKHNYWHWGSLEGREEIVFSLILIQTIDKTWTRKTHAQSTKNSFSNKLTQLNHKLIYYPSPTITKKYQRCFFSLLNMCGSHGANSRSAPFMYPFFFRL